MKQGLDAAVVTLCLLVGSASAAEKKFPADVVK